MSVSVERSERTAPSQGRGCRIARRRRPHGRQAPHESSLGQDTTLGLDTDLRSEVAYQPIGSMPAALSDNRTRLVQAALKLFATRSYYHTSIDDILRESGCKRGTLYYYFSSKEELGHAAIDESVRLVIEQGATSRLQADEHPIDRLIKTLGDLPSHVKLGRSSVVTAGIGARMAAVHEGFRQRLERNVEALVDQVATVVRAGVADGHIVDSVDPDQVARMFATVGMGIQYSSSLLQRDVIWKDTQRWLKDYLNSLRK
jgi:TetR/AcrR family transcriptional repressor of nem operon